MKNNAAKMVLAAVMAASMLPTAAVYADDSMNMFENSDFIETEQPELNAETKQLISLYQRDPSMENYLNLRDMVIVNYNSVLDRKEAKLASLKEETAGKPGGDEKVAEMEEIVQEMYLTYWNRINSTMLRFTDSRLMKWSIPDAASYEYIPVMGAGETIYVKRTPVTNAEYAEYVAATGAEAPSNWINGAYTAGEDDFPVNYVSYENAESYCEWLTAVDGVNTYRLPNESEWELAAGHMPKDAAFNCGVNDGRTPVEQYAADTRGAHGAVDFWGNVWEWTSTVRYSDVIGVKGGSWKSDRTDCRTEYRKEGRNMYSGYDDVGFRVIQVQNGAEPAQKVELATLSAPTVKAEKMQTGSVVLSWSDVSGAVEYQIFEYNVETGLVRMLDRTSDTSYIVMSAGENCGYIVQPISYTAICDNVSFEYAVIPGDKQDFTEPAKPSEPTEPAEPSVTDEIVAATAAYNFEKNIMTISWNAVDGAEKYYVYKLIPGKKMLTKPRVLTGRTSCSYKASSGAEYFFIITTEEISNRKGYNGDFSANISIPEF